MKQKLNEQNLDEQNINACELDDEQLDEVSGGVSLADFQANTRPGGLKLGQAAPKPTCFNSSKSDDRLP